jgi:hypothetical protein
VGMRVQRVEGVSLRVQGLGMRVGRLGLELMV